MDFISNQESQVKAMLARIGARNVEELFRDIPQNLKLIKPEEDDGISEYEGMRLMESIAAKNTFPNLTSYLGAGAYEHHVPALVGAICSKSEFLTSYTPYQAEASQGMLQAIFEYQSVICALTGMDVSNASLYDGATACAEAILMAMRINNSRNKILIAYSIHPHYRKVLEQVLSSHEVKIESIPFNDHGSINQKDAIQCIDNQTAAVLIQYPNFFGVIDDLIPITQAAKSHGALSVICANPLAYGLYASASELGADIAVGDTQPFGLPLQYGGPYVGYMACRQQLVRQMPGRIVGETLDLEGRRGFVLTLQAREQHIRREKATSNICTNQALASIASLIAILWYGKEGIKKLALTNYQRTAYLKNRLETISEIKMMGNAPFFNEFAFSFGCPFQDADAFFLQQGIALGIDLGKYFPSLKNMILVSVTETKDKELLDNYVRVAQEFVVKIRK